MFAATPVIDGLGQWIRELFELRTPTLIVDADGTRRVVVADLCDSAWIIVLAYLNEDGDPARLRYELEGRTAHLPREMVAAWADRFRLRAEIDTQDDHVTLAEAVCYLVLGLREDPELEAEDLLRWAESQRLRDLA